MEKFSVSMCVYGGDNPDWFRIAVESILNQTAKPDEVVLVVDGPVPEAMDAIICEYEKAPVFHVIRLEKNMGHGEARRTGLTACKNDLVASEDFDFVKNIFSSAGSTIEIDESDMNRITAIRISIRRSKRIR